MTTISCPGCGCNHDVPEVVLVDFGPDSLDLLCDACAEEYDAVYAGDFDDSLDGDHESALASAGFGVDEDYGDYGQYDDFDRDFGYDEC